MVNTRLTIGMATHRDFDGVYFTVNALRLYHADVMSRCELVIVDNDPDGPQGERLRNFCSFAGALPADWPHPVQVRYVPYRDANGTAAPRNHIFEVAQCDAVLVLDSHVNLWPGAIASLLDWYDAHPENLDLIQGPLVYDDLGTISTHFADVWRDGMWGTWETDPRGLDPSAPPFEIPAQGLGLFSCRTAAWLGFHPDFREFGGEEWYIHEKFRQHGRHCLCLPALRWIHRFEAPGGGRAYRYTVHGKVRNYILGLQELNLPLDRLRRHYVEGLNEDPESPVNLDGHLTHEEFERLVDDPCCYPVGPAADGSLDNSNCESLDELYRRAVETPSDINEHCETLRALSTSCETVVEFGVRRGVSTVALLAGQPQYLISVDLNFDPIVDQLARISGRTQFEFWQGSSLEVTIPACDLLLIDTYHTGQQLIQELERHASHVRHWIAFHDTEIFGESGEDGGPGLLSGLVKFLGHNAEWHPIYHARHNHGLTIIGRLQGHPLPFSECDFLPDCLLTMNRDGRASDLSSA